jgi:hypothetical protein
VALASSFLLSSSAYFKEAVALSSASFLSLISLAFASASALSFASLAFLESSSALAT